MRYVDSFNQLSVMAPKGPSSVAKGLQKAAHPRRGNGSILV